MTAGKHNFTIEQGTTFSPVLTWRDENGALINLSGYTARMQVRASPEDSTTLLSLTTENGGISLGGAAGTITLSVSASATAALTAGTGVYDLELVVSGSGVVTRLLEGAVVIRREVTR